METRHIVVAFVGQIIIICIVAFIFVHIPVSTKILDVDFDNVNERLDGFSNYGIEPNDLRYLKAIGKSLAAAHELNQSNLNLLHSLTKYYFSLIFVSLFLAVYLSVLFFKIKRKNTYPNA